MNTHRILLIILCCVNFTYKFAVAESATDYPSKPIHIIVPVAAGGNVDIVARTLGNEMSKILGQTVVVENKPSSASIVGTQYVAKQLRMATPCWRTRVHFLRLL